MNKQEIYNFLSDNGIWHEITEHPPIFNMEEAAQITLPYPEADAKNLFVRDDKKRNYYLITVRGDKKVNLKVFKEEYKTRNLSFASAESLFEILGLTPGSVSPFGLLNDTECRVHFYLDEDFTDSPGLIGIHPNENTATVFLKTEALIDIIKNHGNSVSFFKP